MKKSFKAILISLLIIILIAAVVVFAYRQEIWDYLSAEADISLDDVVYSAQVSVEDTIDLEILKSKTLNSLEQQITDFDFDNICHRPTVTIKTTEGTITQTKAGCALGTRLPFLTEKK